MCLKDQSVRDTTITRRSGWGFRWISARSLPNGAPRSARSRLTSAMVLARTGISRDIYSKGLLTAVRILGGDDTDGQPELMNLRLWIAASLKEHGNLGEP